MIRRCVRNMPRRQQKAVFANMGKGRRRQTKRKFNKSFRKRPLKRIKQEERGNITFWFEGDKTIASVLDNEIRVFHKGDRFTIPISNSKKITEGQARQSIARAVRRNEIWRKAVRKRGKKL